MGIKNSTSLRQTSQPGDVSIAGVPVQPPPCSQPATRTTDVGGHDIKEIVEVSPVPPTQFECMETAFTSLENLDMVPKPPNFSDSFSDAEKRFSTLPVDIQKIDSGFPTKATIEQAARSEEFRYFQVEQLLSQCASFLERGFNAQDDYQRLAERSIATWLEIKEFIELDAIHADETRAGYYALPAISAQAESNAQLHIAQGMSWAAQGVPADRNEKYLSDDYQGQSLSASSRLSAATDDFNYQKANVVFRKRRTEVARRNNLIKLQAYTQPGGTYNYEERRLALQERFNQDFGAAMARVPYLKIGLSRIYGIPFNLDLTSKSPFDAALVAVRDASESLMRFVAKEQSLILTISLKSLLGDKRWLAGFAIDGLSAVWSVPVDAKFFPDQAHVRLRGISATVESAEKSALFQVLLRVPSKAQIRDLNNVVSEIDQSPSILPPTRIGRVRATNVQHPPDVVGGLSLYNVSPIGSSLADLEESSWKIGITSSLIPLSDSDLAKGLSGRTTSDPCLGNKFDDLTIYLQIVFRAL